MLATAPAWLPGARGAPGILRSCAGRAGPGRGGSARPVPSAGSRPSGTIASFAGV
ncbi:hypothetical protein Athai_47940 [Actinocatenispora thailandica]|uniref:Uncharacterized protein n=1 Tax=Actinocatenispora thailandica TaxID=227318 RepID=A0A7R7DT72_9ACTN|nr:hypothetical protein Athai_47940 [Actinocatenispora thailandica]